MVTSNFDTEGEQSDPPLQSDEHALSESDIDLRAIVSGKSSSDEERTAHPMAKALAQGNILNSEDAKRCRELMAHIIHHFTPILFTPAATPHMACTDVFADTWMTLVIQPALEDDGVYKPLETLQRMKTIDWAKEGLCELCVREKREEWTEEQRVVWARMDQWLCLDAGEDKAATMSTSIRTQIVTS